MALLSLSLFMLAQGCLSATISFPTVPTLDLKRRSVVSNLNRRQTTSLKLNAPIDYLADVTFGDQTFQLQIDTGSSDTWVIQNGYLCGNGACKFGPGYKTPGTFRPVEGAYLNITYGDKTHVMGPIGYENISVGGFKMNKAPVSIGQLVSTTTGDAVTSGIMGLGYSLNTHGYNASTSQPFRPPYEALVPRMFSTGLIKENMFSLALSSKGGKLAFGGLPQGISYDKPLTTAPIVPGAHYPDGSPAYTAYQVNATWSYPGAPGKQSPDTILMDSGSSINSVPTRIVNAIGAKFQPPADADGSVPCNAVAPSFGLVIGGKEFLMKEEDMIFKDPTDGTCSLAFQADDDDFIMGDSFLRSVLVVYDLGKSTLSFGKLT